MDFDRWADKDVEQMYNRLDQMRVHPSGSNLFDQLEFCEHLDAVLELVESSTKPREILLEAWLLIDYMVTYLLRDAIHLPECIDSSLKLIPFQFARKIELIKKLRNLEKDKLPNQKSYAAYELHPEFHSELMKDEEFYKTFLMHVCRFEQKRCPKESITSVRHDFQRSRFVPEWWYQRVSLLDDEWFQSCEQLNMARNLAAHKMRMTNHEVFQVFGVSCLADFKSILRKTIDRIVFRKRT